MMAWGGMGKDMGMRGYVNAYRSSWTHDVFKNLLEASIWNFLYQNAYWEEGTRTFNNVKINLERGQIATTARFLAEGFETSEKKIRNLFKKMEQAGMITCRATNKITVVTICNYEKYQTTTSSRGEQRANKGRTKGEQTELENPLLSDTCDDNLTPKGEQRANKGRTKGANNERKKERKNKEEKIEKEKNGFREKYPEYLYLYDEGKNPFVVAGKGSRITEDWELCYEWGAWAVSEKGIAAHAVEHEADKFKSYFLSEDAKSPIKKNWYQAWQRWINNKIGGSYA